MAKKTVSDLTHTGQVNSFTGGLNTDLHPLVQPNDTLTDCVNGTLITYNGNENMLQNDMGNYALEGAELPDGFIPLGMKEHNGVAYIVSQNPMTKEVQIGSYPSPKMEVRANDYDNSIDNIDMSVKDDLLQMYITYARLKEANCLATQKNIPEDRLLFSQELRPGDYYCISESKYADFQYQQFYIETSTGSKTNIYPVISNNGEYNPVSWDTIGKLGVSTFMDNVTNFTQSVSYTINDISENEDLASITINNQVTFDRIDYVKEKNIIPYVGVLYEIKYCQNDKEIEESFIKLLPVTNNLQYSFICTKSNISFIGDEDKYISIDAYPILLTRKRLTNQQYDKYYSVPNSILCYDNCKKESKITKKLTDSINLKFQYNVDHDDEDDGDIVMLYMDKGESSFDAKVWHINEAGELYKTTRTDEPRVTKMTFTYNDDCYIGETRFLGDDVIVLEFELNNTIHRLPIFKSMPYYKLKDTYNNFCLVPSSEFLYNRSHVYITESETLKYVKILDDNIVINSDSEFNIYNEDNIAASYGDVILGDLTIAGVYGDTCTVDMQIESDGNWVTLEQYKAPINNSVAEFKDIIVNTCIKQSIFSDKTITHIGQREYLLKSGHVPFAFKSNENDWKDRVQKIIECEDDDFEAIKKYCDINNKKTIYIDKSGGFGNVSFAYSIGDIYGNVTEDRPICSSYAGWLDVLNKYKQLYLPVRLYSNLRRAGYFIPTGKDDCTIDYKTNVDTFAFISKTPTSVMYDYNNASIYNADSLDLIEKYLFGLYTHVFKYINIGIYNKDFKLIEPSEEQRNCRLIVNVSPYIILSSKKYSLQDLNMNFIDNLTSECYNFNSDSQEYETQINNVIESKLWNYIKKTNDILLNDNDNLQNSDINLFVDLPDSNNMLVATPFNKIENWLTETSTSELQLEFRLFINEFKDLYIEDNKWQWPDVNSHDSCSVAYVVGRPQMIEDSANNIYTGSINFWGTLSSFILAKNKTWKEKDLECTFWHLFDNTSDAFKWTLYGTEPKTNYKN